MERFPKVSNKTVRKQEKYLAVYYHKEGGSLQKTNRGYFLNGVNISVFSAQAWLAEYGVLVNGVYRPAKVYRKRTEPIKSTLSDDDKDRRAAQEKRRKHRQTMYELAVGPTQIPKGDW